MFKINICPRHIVAFIGLIKSQTINIYFLVDSVPVVEVWQNEKENFEITFTKA